MNIQQTQNTPEFSYRGTVIQEESSSTAWSSTTIKDKKKDVTSTCESYNGTSTVPSAYSQYGADPTTIKVSFQIK